MRNQMESWARIAASAVLLGLLLAAAPDAAAQGRGGGRGGDDGERGAGRPERVERAERQGVGRGRGAEMRQRGPDQRGPDAADRDRGAGNRGRGAGDVRAGSRDVPPGQARGAERAPTWRERLRVFRRADVPPGQVAREAAGRVAAPAARYTRPVTLAEVPAPVLRFARSRSAPERLAAAVVARAHLRGVPGEAIVIVPAAMRVRVMNRDRDLLLELDDDRARTLGFWRVVPVRDEVGPGSPAFCRSGEGHPVWGRQWCLDRGFGLGMHRDLRFGRVVDPTDVVFRRQLTPAELLTRAALVELIGEPAFNRLAMHAVSLGLVEPLTARVVVEPGDPAVVYVRSGDVPVAELVDVTKDGRADVIVVSLRPW